MGQRKHQRADDISGGSDISARLLAKDLEDHADMYAIGALVSKAVQERDDETPPWRNGSVGVREGEELRDLGGSSRRY